MAEAAYWSTLARALEEVSLGRRGDEAAAVLREGIGWLPREVELYLTLGTILERTDTAAAVELYTSFPPPAAAAEPGFDHAVLANSAVRLLIERRDFGSPWLVEMLVTVGKVLGMLNIERHVQALDLANATGAIKEVYLRVLPAHIDQSAFFKSKGWDYERGAPAA